MCDELGVVNTSQNSFNCYGIHIGCSTAVSHCVGKWSKW